MRRGRSVVLAAVLLATVAGCSKGGGEASDRASLADPAPGATSGAASDAGGQDRAEARPAGVDKRSAETAVDTTPAEIVYTADLTVRVDDPAKAARAALTLVEGRGGSLGSQTEADGDDTVRITVRIPVQRFRATLDAIAGLGTELDRRVDAQEVTDQVVDLERRLGNARASADRLRDLYGTAADVNQVVAIEEALTRREAEVESLQGQLQVMRDQARRSTITVAFVSRGEPTAPVPADDASTFVKGIRAGRNVLGAVGSALAGVGGFLVPLAPFVVVAGLATLAWRRRSRRRNGADRDDRRPPPPGGGAPVAGASG